MTRTNALLPILAVIVTLGAHAEPRIDKSAGEQLRAIRKSSKVLEKRVRHAAERRGAKQENAEAESGSEVVAAAKPCDSSGIECLCRVRCVKHYDYDNRVWEFDAIGRAITEPDAQTKAAANCWSYCSDNGSCAVHPPYRCQNL